MRRISSAAVIGLLVAMQGCTINIPSNLFTTALPTPVPTGVTSFDCAARFQALDQDGDELLSEPEYAGGQPISEAGTGGVNVKKLSVKPIKPVGLPTFASLDSDGDGRLTLAEFSVDCRGGVPPKPTPKPGASIKPPLASGAFFGMESCEHALKKLDTDRDGRLSPGEFAVWQLGLQSTAQPAVCVEPQAAIVADTGAGYGVLRAPAVFPSPSDKTVCEAPRPTVVLPPFEKWDGDRDQFIDRAELCEAANIAPPPQPPRPVCEDTFKHIDRNADGAISPEEYFAGDFAPPLPDGMGKPAVMPSEGELAARFKGLDANADGRLDPREYCADWGNATLASPDPAPRWDDCYAMVKSYDRNQDGQVTWEEYYEGFLMPLSARYEGQKDEVYARFKGLDRNGDGVLAPDEYCSPDATPTATPTPSETARPDDLNR